MLKSLSIATILALLFFATAPRSWALQAGSGVSAADAKETYNYTLTMDKVQKMSAGTHALMELGKHRPEMNEVRNAHSIDAMVQNIQRYPEAVAAIRSSGLAPREYVVCLMTVMQASMAVGFRKSGAYKDYPPELLQQVSRSNLQFTEQHWDQIRSLTPGENGAE
ncbi:MAG TPA: hypothetical protein VJU82_16385 [Acidobacteriaceae bacterium]|nr:hypothetical protein [Acidobacteriaceae bacterium]